MYVRFTGPVTLRDAHVVCAPAGGADAEDVAALRAAAELRCSIVLSSAAPRPVAVRLRCSVRHLGSDGGGGSGGRYGGGPSGTEASPGGRLPLGGRGAAPPAAGLARPRRQWLSLCL